MELPQYRVKERIMFQDLKHKIDAFSDEDPELLKTILKVAPQFLNNPRDLKRFMNVFRFQYFLLIV